MNLLTQVKRVQIVRALVEGCSMRSTARMSGVSVNTVMKLLVDLGTVCREHHDKTVHGVYSERVQADEVWAFCYAKDKNLPDTMRGQPGVGSVWTWTALDSDSKLMLTWFLGDRDAGSAYELMQDLASRLAARVELTTDGHGVYPSAVWEAFDVDIDHAQLVKHYGASPQNDSRYSPAICTGCTTVKRIDKPVREDISTSHDERSNLTLRMGNHRLARLTNAFSKKFTNLACSVSLFFTYYNFCRVHKTLGETPAQRARLVDHAWTVEELVGLLEAKERAAIEAGEHKRGRYRKRSA